MRTLPQTVLRRRVPLYLRKAFGFNAGSACLMPHVAAAIAGLVGGLIEWVAIKRPTALGFATGAVAGLVVTTPSSGFVDLTGALVIGAGVSFLSYFFDQADREHRQRSRYRGGRYAAHRKPS